MEAENGSPPTSSAQTNEAQHMSLTELKDCLVIMRQHHSLSPLEMIKQAHRFFHLFYIKASELPIPSIPELTTAKSVNFTLPAVAPRHDLEIPTSMEILKCSHYNSELLQSVISLDCLKAIKEALDFYLGCSSPDPLVTVVTLNLLACALITTVKKDGPDPNKDQAVAEGFVPLLAKVLKDADTDTGVRFFATGLVRNLARLDLVPADSGIPEVLVLQLSHPLIPLKLCTMSCMINIVLRDDNSPIIVSATPEIVELLDHDDELVREYASSTLWNMSLEDRHRPPIRNAGATPKILNLLKTTNEQILKSALATCRNLAYESDSKTDIMKLGGAKIIIDTLRYDVPDIQIRAVSTIWNLSSEQGNQTEIFELGGLSKIIDILLTSSNDGLIEKCLGAITNLGEHSASADLILSRKVPDRVVQLLTEQKEGVQDKCSSFLWNLSFDPDMVEHIMKTGAHTKAFEMVGNKDIPKSVRVKLMGMISELALEASLHTEITNSKIVKHITEIIKETSDDEEMLCNASCVLSNLCGHESLMNDLKESDVFNIIVDFIDPTKPTRDRVLFHALSAIWDFCAREETRSYLSEFDLVPKLINLTAKSDRIKERALGSLWNFFLGKVEYRQQLSKVPNGFDMLKSCLINPTPHILLYTIGSVANAIMDCDANSVLAARSGFVTEVIKHIGGSEEIQSIILQLLGSVITSDDPATSAAVFDNEDVVRRYLEALKAAGTSAPIVRLLEEFPPKVLAQRMADELESDDSARVINVIHALPLISRMKYMYSPEFCNTLARVFLKLNSDQQDSVVTLLSSESSFWDYFLLPFVKHTAFSIILEQFQHRRESLNGRLYPLATNEPYDKVQARMRRCELLSILHGRLQLSIRVAFTCNIDLEAAAVYESEEEAHVVPRSVDKKVSGMGALVGSSRFSDMTIIVEGQKINCHKAILLGHSSYFRALFDSGMTDAESNELVIDLEGITHASFLEFLRYVYSDACVVTEDTVESLVQLADLYGEPGLTTECAKFIFHRGFDLGTHYHCDLFKYIVAAYLMNLVLSPASFDVSESTRLFDPFESAATSLATSL